MVFFFFFFIELVQLIPRSEVFFFYYLDLNLFYLKKVFLFIKFIVKMID
jgi:hypothetical protein